MQGDIINKDIQIAGMKTVQDWLTLKAKIEQNPKDIQLWGEAFVFFELRIQTRYLCPAKTIQNSKSSQFTGEGFAISAIICSLIEALESFYQGKNYRYLNKGESLGPNEYNKSSEMFVSFLTTKTPFNNYFPADGDLARSFYKNVRCALLHEACTKNGWTIRVDTNDLLTNKGGKYILNRFHLLSSIEEYIKKYKTELLADDALKENFIRKMNYLCDIA
jgi:hypothetical protein